MLKIRYISPRKLRTIMGMFLCTGAAGILIGLQYSTFHITVLGTINLCLGGVFGWILLTQPPRDRDRRKKARRSKSDDGAGLDGGKKP